MSFIHHKHSREFLLMACNQVAAQLEQKFALVFSRPGKSQIAHHVLQELKRGQAAIEDVCIRDVTMSKQLQQATDEKGLTGPHLPGHYHETLVPANAVVKRSQSLIVSACGKQERGIWGDLEGISSETEKSFIH